MDKNVDILCNIPSSDILSFLKYDGIILAIDEEQSKKTIKIDVPVKYAVVLSLDQLKKGYLRSARKNYDIIIVKGGDIDTNKQIVRYPIDFLLDPVSPKKVGIDEPTIHVAKENGIRFAYSLATLKDMSPFTRATMLSKLTFLNKLLISAKWLPYVFSMSKTPYGMRDFIDMKSLLVATGIPFQYIAGQGSYLYERFFHEG